MMSKRYVRAGIFRIPIWKSRFLSGAQDLSHAARITLCPSQRSFSGYDIKLLMPGPG